MIPADFPRSLAVLLLRFAIWIAPHDTLDWGRGMLSELHHVEGNWSALFWAVGGAGVLAKHAMLALILPGSHRRTVSSASEIFAKELPMRKATLTAIGACIAASLLFFLAPVFRQAFQVSLLQWRALLHAGEYAREVPGLQEIQRRAEQNHDAEGLAFVAVRHWNASESARLADEAVRLDPKIAWIYGPVASTYSSLPQIDDHWVAELKKFDPENALPYFIAAEKIDIDEIDRNQIPHNWREKSIPWQTAMASAFESRKLDDYGDRMEALDRRVFQRYHIVNPSLLSSYAWPRLPSYTAADSGDYAQALIAEAQSLEAKGDLQGATAKYFVVVRFGDVLDQQINWWLRGDVGKAYAGLGGLAEKEARPEETRLYTSLAAQKRQPWPDRRALRRWRFFEDPAIAWSAHVTTNSGLALLFSIGLLLTCILAVVVRNRSVRFFSLRPSQWTLALGLASSLILVFSSVLLYLSYRPYAQIFRRFVDHGDDRGLADLVTFVDEAHVPFGFGGWLSMSRAAFDFWFVVAAGCLFALCIAVFRHFQTRPRAHAPT
ncbi:MAG: hypothetical protein WB627_05220 [Candidatus Acidiferrum sp.]